MNQKTLLSVAGLAGLALTAGLLIASAHKSESESVAECIKRATYQQMQAAGGVVNLCSGVVAPDAPDTPEMKKKLAKLTAEVEAEAAAALAAESQTPATVERTYSYEEAMTEACEAGRQYRNDVELGYMQTQQSFDEARSYAHHLSAQSAGVDNGVLYAKIKECMW